MMKVGSQAALDSSTVELSMILADKNGNKESVNSKPISRFSGRLTIRLASLNLPRG